MEKTTTFQQRLQFGEEGEHLIGSYFVSSSFAVMPLYQFSASHAPFVIAQSGSYTAPDLMVWKNSEAAFADAKRKRQWVHWDGQTETGLNYEHYKSYLALSDATGIPLFVFFIHQGEKAGIYATEIHNKNFRKWNGRTPNGRYIGQPEILFVSESLKRIHYAEFDDRQARRQTSRAIG